MRSGEQGDGRIVLVRIEIQAGAAHPVQERGIQAVGVPGAHLRERVDEWVCRLAGGHGGPILSVG